jgi:hypothetical protein
MTQQQEHRSRVVFTILFLFGAYAFISDDDYHKTFDIFTPVQYNCDMLIGGWHPDVPKKVIDECRKKMKETHVTKTY